MTGDVREMLTSVARQGLKVIFVAQPDACRACRRLQGRIFDPLKALPIPVSDCLTPPCRCRYEGYDARSVVTRLLTAGVDAVNEERLEDAKELLYQVIDLDERNDKAWLWLSGIVEGIDERIMCLENVLAVNPHHELAREGLRHLLAQRAELRTGQQTAKRIKDAREAIDHLKASQAKVMTLKETPRMAKTPSGIGMTGRHVVARLLQQEPQEWERPSISFATVFLYVLLSVSVLVLVFALLLYAATMLR
jgi:hypothetical protein